MTPSPPPPAQSPPPGPPPGPPPIEDLLRARLREVDELLPPDTNFEQRVLRAGRERVSRRRSWTRVLVGAAAAVTIGAFVAPAVVRQESSSSGSGASSAAAGASASGGQRDQGLSGPAPQAPDGSSGPVQTPESESGQDLTLTLPVGTTPFDWGSADGQARLERLRAALLEPPYAASSTTLRVDSSVDPPRLVVRMSRDDSDVIALVTMAFPVGAPIVFTLARA